jgi:hypothetical protein
VVDGDVHRVTVEGGEVRPRVADEDVQHAERLPDLVEQAPEILGAGQVGLD